jgi:hypothetical protein
VFTFLVGKSASFFGFLSGIFVSVATNTVTGLVFATAPLPNVREQWVGAVATLLAGVGWFLTAELVADLRGQMERSAVGLHGSPDERAKTVLGALERDHGPRLYTLVTISFLISVTWPFIVMLI